MPPGTAAGVAVRVMKIGSDAASVGSAAAGSTAQAETSANKASRNIGSPRCGL